MRRGLSLALAAALCTPVAAAEPAEIVAAKRAGEIGERYDGYLGFAAETSRAVHQKVTAINITRRSLYTALAARKHVQPSDIGITAGCTTLATVEVGDVYWLGDQWRKRQPGQPAPVPDYC